MENQTNAGTADNVTTQTNSVLATAASETTTQVTKTPADAPPVTNFAELLNQDGRFVDQWTTRLPEQLAEHTKTLAKFKSPVELMTSYASLEKEFSKRTSEKVKMPAEDAAPEDWDAYKSAIGANFKPEDYGLKPAEGADWSKETVDKATQIAAKYGIPKPALKEFVGIYNDSIKTMVAEAETVQAQQFETVMSDLKKEWGVNLNTNLQKAQRAALAVGLDPNDTSIGNNPAIIKALMKVDELLAEDKTIATGATSSAQTYQEMYDKVLNSDDYRGKNGLEKQMAAAEKLKGLFDAMRK